MTTDPRVFVNYRRADAGASAHRIDDRLSAALGRGRVFLDLPSIPAGVNFREAIERSLAGAAVMVSVVGPNWLDQPAKEGWARDQGRRRIDEDDDLVRWEIRTALEGRITLIPVLVEGASMPPADKLPADIRAFSMMNAIQIPTDYFDEGVGRLLERIRGLIDSPEHLPFRHFFGPDEATLSESWEMLLREAPSSDVLPESLRPLIAARTWIAAKGGCDYGVSHLRLDLVGLHERPVHIRDIRAAIVDQRSRAPGIKVSSPAGGDSSPVGALIRLDADAPIAFRLPPDFNPYTSDPYGISTSNLSPITATLVKDELLSFQLHARAGRAEYDWKLELRILVDGESSTVHFPEEGSITTTNALADDVDYTWAWFAKPLRLLPTDGLSERLADELAG